VSARLSERLDFREAGERLRVTRGRLRLTRLGMSGICGVSVSTIACAESGEKVGPRAYGRMSEALGISLLVLFGQEDLNEVTARVISRALRWDGPGVPVPVITGTRPVPPPLTREECESIDRPCDRYACRHHLYIEMRLRGGEELGDKPSCSLDVAEDGTHTLEEVGEIFGLTRERIRQIEAKALRKLRLPMIIRELDSTEPLQDKAIAW
tara:strand:- start:6903 stop:7532 length:630 start_codon:yes stop_codon:yes gene_type:complete